MKKNNNKRKRTKPPLKANTKRQAHAQLRGYLYQIWHSVNAWLDLADDEFLYLEGAEDFEKISSKIATATQVKHTQNNITLRSEEVFHAINNFWELRTNNPDQCVKFRFLTTSKIGKEQYNPFGADKKGIECWIRCSGDEETISRISEFLLAQELISDEVKKFLKKKSPQEIYKKLIQPITWETDNKSIDFVEQSVNDRLVLHGNRQPIPIPPSDAKKAVDHLLKEALIVATKEETRVLTKVRFLEIFEEQTTQRIPTQHLHRLQSQAMMTDVGLQFNNDSSGIAIQLQSHIQTDVPPTFLDVLVPRTELLTDIQSKLQTDGIVVIHGGAGKGKTTLAKTIANTMSGTWIWLNFTNIDPLSTDFSFQVSQRLRQLTIALHDESSQVNVVLDDLSLQSRYLHRYKEELGVAVYNILNRGAKLLITSQHKPPNSFIRSVGMSSSIVMDIPNFTISEIEQFSREMGCPSKDAETWISLIQAHTDGHPKLVHAWLIRLHEDSWNEQNLLDSIQQRPKKIIEEQEAARQLITDLPEDHRNFLYRLSLITTGFRKDYAINIGEIPEAITDPGNVFSQLVGPWVDQINETYYTISPLLKNAAKEVWSDETISNLHVNIANAIIKTKELTSTDAWTVFTHSMVGQYKEGIIAFIYSFMSAPQNDWKNLCQEFSLLAHIKTDPPTELFPGDTFVNQLFRSLQYRIAVEVKPELVPKILEIWDKETKPYEPRQSYLLSRLMLTVEILKYNQVTLPAKKLIGYLKEIINIKNMDKEVWKSYFNSMEELKEINVDESNFFSFLFSFIYMRPEINAVFLNELIDTLDKLDPRIRTLLLVDFENDTIQSQLFNNGVWLTEDNLENPDWTSCLEVFDKVIEKTIAWGYPHIAAAAAKIQAITHDEKLKNPDTGHEVLNDITSKLGTLPVIEEARAVIYFNQKRFKEALDIYDRILPKWDPPSEQVNIGPSEEYRRAAICASYLDDWKKAANFLEVGAKKTQEIGDTDIYIGLYTDAGFAQFKAGNILESIKLLTLALQEFEKLPQDNTDLKYYALKKRLAGSIGWVAYHEDENFTSGSLEPTVAFCSNQEINEEVLNLPDSPIEMIWLALTRIELKFGDGNPVLEHVLQIAEKTNDPKLRGSLALLELQYDFRNKTLENLPERIHRSTTAFALVLKQKQTEIEIEKKEINSLYITDLSNSTSVEYITGILVSGLLSLLAANRDWHEMLSVWRTNSFELPIKDNIYIVLDLIESILLGDYNQALTAMKTENKEREKRVIASLKVIMNKETSLENLFYAHTHIASSLFNHTWLEPVAGEFGKLISDQWLEKIKTGEMSLINKNIVQQIERACNSSETGKKKIGQILLAAYLVVTTMIDPQTLQKFRAWTGSESQQIQEHTIGKNHTAQRLINAMEQPPYLTDEDIEALNQSIKEGEIPIKFHSPFELDEQEDNE